MRKGDPAQDPPQGEGDIVWPEFHNHGKTYPTEFEGGSWKCPLCSYCTPRIQQHLANHKDLIQDWSLAEKYCKEVAILKRRELERKRAKGSKRRETLRKADHKREPKRADDPQRRETLRKAGKNADQKRVDDPQRREALRKAGKKADQKRAKDPQRKMSRALAQELYRENLGEMRRRAQFRKYQ